MPFSILHISDLHRSPRDPISNDELISALVSDKNRYLCENPRIAPPQAIIVSGDIIQGVTLRAENFATEIAEQYATAEAFLDELVRRFLDGDRSRLILVPGNHDIDWNTAFAALEPVHEEDIPSDLASILHGEDSALRWDWKTRTLYRIADPDLYNRRFDAYWAFFEKFYAGVPALLNVHAKNDANYFSLCDDRIGVAGFNSCHGNDCFAFHGMIRKETIARSHLDLDDCGKIFDLRVAVWHHSIDGPPYRTDYMDVNIVRGMIGRGFRLGLYGHQHKTQVSPQEIWLPDRERMAIISSGSLCAGKSELPTGYHRQYNILEIADDFSSVRVHVRAMNVANLFSRGHFFDFGGASFADLDWTPPRNAVGAVVDTKAQRARAYIDEAEHEAKTGNPSRALAILRAIELPPGSYERQLCLTAAIDAQDWSAIIAVTNPPVTIEELVQRFEALSCQSDHAAAIEALDRFSKELQLPEQIAAELRKRANSQKAMNQ